jgi:mRNA-degrading endonuclease toxin of MazEF toxin-antitoxin module
MRRGDVVLLDFPFIDRPGSKIGPAVIVQNDRDNARLRNTIAAIVTGNLRRAGEPTQALVDP